MADVESGGGPKPPVKTETAERPQVEANSESPTDKKDGGKVTLSDGTDLSDLSKQIDAEGFNPDAELQNIANLPDAKAEGDLTSQDVATVDVQSEQSIIDTNTNGEPTGMAGDGPATTDQLRQEVADQLKNRVITPDQAADSLKTLDARDAAADKPQDNAPLFPDSGQGNTQAAEGSSADSYTAKAQKDRLDAMRNADPKDIADQAADGNVAARRVQSENAAAENKPVDDIEAQAQNLDPSQFTEQSVNNAPNQEPSHDQRNEGAQVTGPQAENTSNTPMMTVEVQDEAPQPAAEVKPTEAKPLAETQDGEVSTAAEQIAKDATENPQRQEAQQVVAENKDVAEAVKAPESGELTQEQVDQVLKTRDVLNRCQELGIKMDTYDPDVKNLAKELMEGPEHTDKIMAMINNAEASAKEFAAKMAKETGMEINEKKLMLAMLNEVNQQYVDQLGSKMQEAAKTNTEDDESDGKLLALLKILGKILGTALIAVGTVTKGAGEAMTGKAKSSN